ncbi:MULTISPECIES: penicillin-binding protein 2 [unclassified Pseudofrankia]|uniref:penicillin-binding protein 2 n=1 Tax=unclassified Pseudofrankia TaxID=2994372 RepID=UPI0008DAEDBB|nr:MULTISPECIES: penicillin-binding protein 2 [unclassified Pseudofrankia]MDT3445992.1 penicillin-binding protein 2 [Pseudofrankia sp. BMG5.37]OHV59856.1 penicillin-binding protein 2 [Pseudofrankia sp. BMG5.36]
MNDGMRVRIVVLRVLAVSLLVTLGARLWVLQILDGDRYRKVAETNRVREVVSSAPRGMILDDQGEQLVRNRSSLVISVNRSTTDRQRDAGKAVFASLSSVIGMSVDDIEKKIRFCGPKIPQPCWNGSPYQPVPIAKDVSPAQALAIIEHPERFPGVTADLQAVREYPFGSLGSHELGYLAPVSQDQLDRQAADLKKQGKDPEATPGAYHLNSLVGVSGLESVYDSELRGVDGVEGLEVDRFGRVSGTASNSAPVPGDHLVLNLDRGVQATAEEALRSTLDKLPGGARARTASAVVLDVKTGGVVALASLPSYDPSVFVGGVSQQDYAALSDPANGIPLLSRAYQGSGAVGSTFKPVSTSVAMAKLGAKPNQNFDCAPTLQIGGQTFHNFEGSSAGPITLHRALVISCDVIFDKFAYDEWLRDGGLRNGKGPYPAPAENFVKMAEAMGFGARTGIDLPGETSGSIVDRDAAKANWEELKGSYCERAKNGYPDVRDPATAKRYQQYAAEACVDGYLYNAGAAAQFAIGQGQYLSISPLQLAAAYAAIANGGTLYEPQLAKAVVSPDGKVVKRFEPVVRNKLPVPPEVLAYIRDSLHGVTTEGGGTATGVFADWPNNVIPVGGKTGTAEVEGHEDTSWFASFAPVNDPRYAIVVSIPDSGTGATYAAPVAKAIYQAIFGVGRPAELPGGLPPSALPAVGRDASLAPAPADATGGAAVTPGPAAATPPPDGASPPAAGGARAVAPAALTTSPAAATDAAVGPTSPSAGPRAPPAGSAG